MRRPRLYVLDMLDLVESVAEAVHGIDFAAFAADRYRSKAVIRDIEILGEAARHVPPEIRERAPNIPWKQLVATRNVLIHNYVALDLGIVFRTATVSVPAIRKPLEQLLASLDDV